ncbi:YycH family regulatory protein [Sporosarcina sp. D27]|uniref:YycH family regulatory protein n=1 Tax=Sporosarcina sp. D27 TaxID=1382305 RepID=UPI000472F998|nr:two-component system activity regulator YycH [Sporosarcina sp. D27]
MRHIETIKSVVLLLLVLLSITFTFSIWSYTPQFDPFDQNQSVDGSITSIQNKKPISDIVLPYKWVFKFNDEELYGTTDTTVIQPVLEEMMRWKVFGFTAVNLDLTKDEMHDLLTKGNQYVLYYPGEVPVSVYKDVLEIEDKTVPEVMFNKLIVNWDPDDSLPEVHFVSTVSRTHYKAKVKMEDTQRFQKSIIDKGKKLSQFKEVQVNKTKTLAISSEPLTAIHSTYIEEEINPSLFKDALFNDPNVVRRNLVDSNKEEYGDDHALMKVNTKSKVLNFFYPPESQELAIPSELMTTAIDFVNDHSGWTDDYRYSYMNPVSRYIQFQLHDNGLPVFSDGPDSAEITEILGDNRVSSYRRPYFTLNSPIKSYEVTLPPATEVARHLEASDDLDFTAIEEIKPGYSLVHDTDVGVLKFEPHWFYYINGNWEVYEEDLNRKGGGLLGLE